MCGRDLGHLSTCPAYAPNAKGSDVRYSGTEFEYDMFDQVNVRDPQFREEMARLGAKESGYLPFTKAVELTKKFQPGDPANPRKDFYRELLIALQEKLGVDPESGDLKAYTAVGTPLDKFHGVDAFITLNRKGRETMVTMDATLRKEKLDGGWKADVMVGEVPASEENEDAYLDAIGTIADKVANKFKEQPPQASGWQ
jgi:hypothetical protein